MVAPAYENFSENGDNDASVDNVSRSCDHEQWDCEGCDQCDDYGYRYDDRNSYDEDGNLVKFSAAYWDNNWNVLDDDVWRRIFEYHGNECVDLMTSWKIDYANPIPETYDFSDADIEWVETISQQTNSPLEHIRHKALAAREYLTQYLRNVKYDFESEIENGHISWVCDIAMRVDSPFEYERHRARAAKESVDQRIREIKREEEETRVLALKDVESPQFNMLIDLVWSDNRPRFNYTIRDSIMEILLHRDINVVLSVSKPSQAELKEMRKVKRERLEIYNLVCNSCVYVHRLPIEMVDNIFKFLCWW